MSLETGSFQDSLTQDGRYRLLVEAVTDYAIYLVNPQGIVSSWNAGAQRFKGYTAGEIIGQHFSRFYTDEDRQSGLAQYALETAAREGKFEGEGWRVRKDGTRFWAHVVIDAIRDPAGALVGFAKITRDLTERRQAELVLRRSEEQFRLLVQGVTDYAIYLLDPEGRITSWNAGAQRIKGYRPEEIIGSHFSRFYTDEDRAADAPRKALETALRDGRFEKEGWRVRKDGGRLWANVIIDPIRNDAGELIGFAKVTRDVTERRNNQIELERAREALFQSQKMDAIGQLTGGVAHDFNNLLMAIISSLEIVGKRLPDDPKITSFLDNAMQAAQRGAALTQRMLAFARRQELESVPIDIPSLVQGMSELLRRALGPLTPIELRFPLALPRARADANQLEMALLNLAVNARDAMPQGGPITIEAREEKITEQAGALSPGRYICLSVVDAGEGMDEVTLARAIEPFFTTKGVGKGTGLGLPMVHGLAQQFGGSFILKSQLGRGTTAEIWLPVAETVVETAGATPESPEPEATRPLVVMAVDDDALVLMNTAAMLQDLGHAVIEAASGAEALEQLRDGKAVDLIVTDQAMPRMTGTQLIAAVRAERPQLPIILATGYAELPEGTDASVVRLPKPFRQRDLIAAIAGAVPAPEQRAPNGQAVLARP